MMKLGLPLATMILVLAALFSMAHRAFAQGPPEVTTSSVEIPPGGTATVELVLTEAPFGLSGFIIDVTVPDLVTVLSTVIDPNSFALSIVDDDPDSTPPISLRAVDLSGSVGPGATDVLLATLELQGEPVALGTKNTGVFEITVDRIEDDNGDPISVSITPGLITVFRALPTLDGQTSPIADLDADGLTEDLNGNGRFDFNDLVVLFNVLDSPEIQNNADLFDFAPDGAVNFNDVVGLWLMIVL